MASVSCELIQLTTLQNIMATSVGVAFAYPILAQLVQAKNDKMLMECLRIMKLLGSSDRRSGALDLGAKRLAFNLAMERIFSKQEYMTVISFFVGLFSFFSLFYTSVDQGICVSFAVSIVLCFIYSLPFFLAIFFLAVWYDQYVHVRWYMQFYRGDGG